MSVSLLTGDLGKKDLKFVSFKRRSQMYTSIYMIILDEFILCCVILLSYRFCPRFWHVKDNEHVFQFSWCSQKSLYAFFLSHILHSINQEWHTIFLTMFQKNNEEESWNKSNLWPRLLCTWNILLRFNGFILICFPFFLLMFCQDVCDEHKIQFWKEKEMPDRQRRKINNRDW